MLLVESQALEAVCKTWRKRSAAHVTAAAGERERNSCARVLLLWHKEPPQKQVGTKKAAEAVVFWLL